MKWTIDGVTSRGCRHDLAAALEAWEARKAAAVAKAIAEAADEFDEFVTEFDGPVPVPTRRVS